jgi:hypothetical protein
MNKTNNKIKNTLSNSTDQSRKEQKMENTLTVAELIAILSRLDGTMKVEIGMNQEYQRGIDAEDIRVDSFEFHRNGEPFVFIGD